MGVSGLGCLPPFFFGHIKLETNQPKTLLSTRFNSVTVCTDLTMFLGSDELCTPGSPPTCLFAHIKYYSYVVTVT